MPGSFSYYCQLKVLNYRLMIRLIDNTKNYYYYYLLLLLVVVVADIFFYLKDICLFSTVLMVGTGLLFSIFDKNIIELNIMVRVRLHLGKVNFILTLNTTPSLNLFLPLNFDPKYILTLVFNLN